MINSLQKNKTLKVLKDNLSLIVIVPVLLGGIWQLIELASISFSFIRFFSSSQLIADGLLIIFLLFLFMILVVLTEILADLRNERSNMARIFTENEASRTSSYTLILVMTGFSIFSFLVFRSLFHFMGKVEEMKSFNILSFILTVFAYFFISSHNIRLLKRIKRKYDVEKIKSLLLVFSFVLLFQLYLLYEIGFRLHKSFLLPKNLSNLEVLASDLKTQNKGAKIKLLYFNDKYIFYEIQSVKSKSSKIKIVRFETLMTEKKEHQSR